nr:RNA-directed DNA polymerase, eukaryota, reverse transcriptase zinc-binding domain protein [Tanacetum cinerariifolium]
MSLYLRWKETLDLAQKAKVKGILIDGEWVDNPIRVEQEFYHHFATRFDAPKRSWAETLDAFPNRLSSDRSRVMEEDVSYDEVKHVVWECGSHKAPVQMDLLSNSLRRFGCNSSFIAFIPKVHDAKLMNDLRPISLIGPYKVIGKILANRLAVVIDDLVSMEQSAFIKGRQILEDPFILNKGVAWCKRNKQKSMVFKNDFRKAFDSVRWDFKDDILHRFGFGERWGKWIQGCFTSCMGSILVNGSPTDEFRFQRGLRQGDPLSSFLFLLVIESLHIFVQKIVKRGMFLPIHAGNFKKDKGVDLMEFCQKKVNNGQEIKVSTKLELRDGLGSYRRLPRGGIKEVKMMELCSAISSIIMAPDPDT